MPQNRDIRYTKPETNLMGIFQRSAQSSIIKYFHYFLQNQKVKFKHGIDILWIQI